MTGHDALWHWFGLSYASFITIPRVLAHSMPDEWQGKMAALLEEYEEAFPGAAAADLPSPMVSAYRNRKFCRWPDWVLNYRYPDREQIAKLRTRA